MRVIITGSRHIIDYGRLETAIELSRFEVTEVVSGGAPGPDIMGERWATERSIPVRRFPADRE